MREQTWEADSYHKAGNLLYFYYYRLTSTYEPVHSNTAGEPLIIGNLLLISAIHLFSGAGAEVFHECVEEAETGGCVS